MDSHMIYEFEQVQPYVTEIRKHYRGEWENNRIAENLITMTNQGNQWYEMAIFVYEMFINSSFRHILPTLIKATGYKKSQIYEFKRAGELIKKNNTTEKDIGDISLKDFINPKKQIKAGTITDINRIGEYAYDPNSKDALVRLFPTKMIYIYSGTYDDRRIFFQSETEIAGNDKIEVLPNTESEDKNDRQYYYHNNQISLYYFDPTERRGVNLYRKS